MINFLHMFLCKQGLRRAKKKQGVCPANFSPCLVFPVQVLGRFLEIFAFYYFPCRGTLLDLAAAYLLLPCYHLKFIVCRLWVIYSLGGFGP